MQSNLVVKKTFIAIITQKIDIMESVLLVTITFIFFKKSVTIIVFIKIELCKNIIFIERISYALVAMLYMCKYIL